MSSNPLFDNSSNQPDPQADSYLLPKNQSSITPIEPVAGSNAAADVIRRKLDAIFDGEPDAKTEIAEVNNPEIIQPRSKHQEFMHDLSQSGKSLAEIQTEWHHYYITLPDDEKHQVWREFYASNTKGSKYHQTVQTAKAVAPQSVESSTAKPGIVVSRQEPEPLPAKPARSKPKKLRVEDLRSAKAIKEHIVDKVSAGGQLKAKHHFQSLLFGIGMGALVIFIFLFGFFNEIIIAPFIQPSRHASATPLILSTDSVAPTNTPEVIIPKINVEIPVDYSATTTDENAIENDLENGVVHYPTTSMPGQNGNAAFFGHSSNNIFNKGKYKFAFVLLHELVNGDTFYLTNNGKVYVYKVISMRVVEPSEVSVLLPVAGQTATATLITCDPPGTSLHRLVVVGQQISPDPSTNTATAATGTSTTTAAGVTTTTTGPAALPGNGPTAWTRFWRWAL